MYSLFLSLNVLYIFIMHAIVVVYSMRGVLCSVCVCTCGLVGSLTVVAVNIRVWGREGGRWVCKTVLTDGHTRTVRSGVCGNSLAHGPISANERRPGTNCLNRAPGNGDTDINKWICFLCCNVRALVCTVVMHRLSAPSPFPPST